MLSALIVQAEDDPFEFFSQEAVVVTASKFPQNRFEAPASAQVITAEDIENFGYQSLAQAINSVAGLYSTNDRNYDYIWVRGFGRSGDYNSRILILINGHRINENLTGGFGLGQDFGLDIESIKRIEIIKGPASALYGDAGFFGVINVITKTGEPDGIGKLSLETGTNKTNKSYVEIYHKIKDFIFFGSASMFQSKGENLFFPEYAQLGEGHSINADAERATKSYFNLSWKELAFQANIADRYKQIPTGAFGTRLSDGETKTIDGRSFAELKWDHKISNKLNFMGRAYYDWVYYTGDYIFDQLPPDDPTLDNRDLWKGNWIGEEVQVRSTHFGNQNSLIVGQELEKNQELLLRNYDVNPTSLKINNTQRPKRWAGYVQQELNLYPKVGITLGVRYDHYQTFGKTINPRIGIVYSYTRQQSLKLLYGSAFRAPSPYEMFYANFISQKPNSNLGPEKIKTLEMVWEGKVNSYGILSASIFKNSIHSLISQYLDPQDDLIQYQNRDSLTSKGLELNSKWKWKQDSAHGGILIQETKDDHNSNMSNSPDITGDIGISHEFIKLRMIFGYEVFFIGARDTLKNTRLEHSYIHNFAVHSKPTQNGISFHVGIYNLTNIPYSTSGAEEHLQTSIPQPRRSLLGGVDIRF